MSSYRQLNALPHQHDTEARFSIKQDLEWAGYKLHITETCDDGLPRLITNVETTAATQPDWLALPVIHEALERKGVVPTDHVADTGYISVEKHHGQPAKAWHQADWTGNARQ